MAGRGGDKEAGEPFARCAHPKSTRVPCRDPQSAGKGLRGSQPAEPRTSPDLSSAAPPHKRAEGGPEPCSAPQGLGRTPQSGEEEEEEDEEGHRQKQQPGLGLAQAQPHAAGFMQGGNWGDTARKPPPQSQAGVPCLPQTSPSPSSGVPTCSLAPPCPGWVFLCSVRAGCSACEVVEAG